MYLDKWFLAVFIFLLVGSMALSLAQHELAHMVFNDKFGLESELVFDLPWAVGVRSSGIQPNELKMMHGFNEAVSYNLTPYLMGILGIIGIGFWYLGNKTDYWFTRFEKKGLTIEARLPKPREEIIFDEVKII